MNWYTVEQLQALANKWNKPVCAWHPLTCEMKNHEGYILWVRDPRGRVKDFTSPYGKDSIPWRDKHSWKMLIRPVK